MTTFSKYTNGAVKTLLMFFSVQMALFTTGTLSSCSDAPDAENYYTFKGQMMSQYLKSNSDFSNFAAIVEKAEIMDQLSAYGHFTCFAPTNAAVNKYLDSCGVTIADLTKDQCDTIARTHLFNVMYSTSDLSSSDNGILRSQNMMRRNVSVSHKLDQNGNMVFVLNGNASIIFEHQDDSVENGIVQPVDRMIVNSTKSLANFIKEDNSVSIYYEALKATGYEMVLDTMIMDKSYVAPDVEKYTYFTGAERKEEEREWAIAPKQKMYGYTAFLVPDAVLKEKYANYFNGAESDVKGLYDLACSIYDTMYPEDVNLPSHDFDHLTDPKNPLNRFMAYHLLDRNVQGYNYLTVRDDLGVDKEYANSVDWYTTMLTGTMVKLEHLIKEAWIGAGDELGSYYINRRYDKEKYFEQGAHVINPSKTIDAINGIYFYLSDIAKFDETTRDVVDNCRIRMDFSTIFPEIMTNNMRMNGDYRRYERQNIDDESIGFNYCFPNGYLKGVKVEGADAKFIYRRPRSKFYSLHGDECIANGVFDVTFEIPPFPFEGDWQVRLGFAAMTTAPRGSVQVFFDGKAAGLPINMELQIASPEIYGAGNFPKYSSIREDEELRASDYKILKNKGYYRGPFSCFHADDPTKVGERFADRADASASTVRKVLCTVNIKKSDFGKRHTLRIKNVSAQNTTNKEGMFDYLELVPKSVFAVTGDTTEDDL
ncbi:MAG: fasciclin domain-containing protein [Prevotella sp.]|nr:fasciclin domain-containing protein [Candidatus Prevotella equi]